MKLTQRSAELSVRDVAVLRASQAAEGEQHHADVADEGPSVEVPQLS